MEETENHHHIPIETTVVCSEQHNTTTIMNPSTPVYVHLSSTPQRRQLIAKSKRSQPTRHAVHSIVGTL